MAAGNDTKATNVGCQMPLAKVHPHNAWLSSKPKSALVAAVMEYVEAELVACHQQALGRALQRKLSRHTRDPKQLLRRQI
jgi:hypothetical protein